jgi:hypothetical protein
MVTFGSRFSAGGDELLHRLPAVKRARRVVRIADVDQAGARRLVRHLRQVELQRVGDRHLDDGTRHVPRQIADQLEGRRGRDDTASGVVNAITAASRISLDPQPSVTCSGWTPSLRASADWTSPAAANE